MGLRVVLMATRRGRVRREVRVNARWLPITLDLKLSLVPNVIKYNIFL
jgi:hypothetical protein